MVTSFKSNPNLLQNSLIRSELLSTIVLEWGSQMKGWMYHFVRHYCTQQHTSVFFVKYR